MQKLQDPHDAHHGDSREHSITFLDLPRRTVGIIMLVFFIFTAFLLFIILPDLSLGLPPSSRSSFRWSDINHVIASGDSYTYVQGSPYGRQNYSFIGDEQNFAFDKRTLLGDAIVQNQVRPSNLPTATT